MRLYLRTIHVVLLLAVIENVELENQGTEKLKTEEQQSQEQKEFEEFKKWKESRKNDNLSWKKFVNELKSELP
jgi:hypothetical protein